MASGDTVPAPGAAVSLPGAGTLTPPMRSCQFHPRVTPTKGGRVREAAGDNRRTQFLSPPGSGSGDLRRVTFPI